jgi:hypothetical protein
MSLNSIAMRVGRAVLALAGLALALVAFLYAIASFEKVYCYAQFGNRSRSLSVEAANTIGMAWGALTITNGDRSVTYLFDDSEWQNLTAISGNLRPGRSPRLKLIGDMLEKDDNNTRLFVHVGTAVRLVLRENGDCVFYDLSPAEYVDYQRSITRVTQHLSGKITGKLIGDGQSSDQRSRVRTITHTLTYWPPTPPNIPECR